MIVSDKPKRRGQLWLGILLSLASLVALFYFIEPAAIANSLASARLNYLLLAALGILAFMVLRAVRWRFMLNNEISWIQTFHIQNIGYMLLNILPFRIGDLARAALIGRLPRVSLAKGLSSLIMERILDLLFIVTLLPLTLAFVPQLPGAAQVAARATTVIAVAAILLLLLAANNRALAGRVISRVLDYIPFLETEPWTRRADDLLAGLSTLTRLRDGVSLGLLSILTWLPIIVAYYAGMRAVNLQPSLMTAAFVVTAAAFTVSAPSSPGQIGVFHAGVTFTLVQLLGQPAAESASFALLYHAMNLILMVVLGAIGMLGTGLSFRNVVQSSRSLRARVERE